MHSRHCWFVDCEERVDQEFCRVQVVRNAPFALPGNGSHPLRRDAVEEASRPAGYHERTHVGILVELGEHLAQLREEGRVGRPCPRRTHADDGDAVDDLGRRVLLGRIVHSAGHDAPK